MLQEKIITEAIDREDPDQDTSGTHFTVAIQERQRLAIKLALSGFEIEHVAHLCEMQVREVHELMNQYRNLGWAAIGPAQTASRSQRRKFTPEHEEKLCAILGSYPEEQGFDRKLWDQSMAYSLVSRSTGVAVSQSALKVYLRRWGFSPGRAVRRAYARDPDIVRYWMKRTYPSIADRARQSNAEILWAGSSVLKNARMGIQRILLTLANNKGQNQWLATDEPIQEKAVMNFLQRAIEGRSRRIILIATADLDLQRTEIQQWLHEHRDVIQFTVTAPFLEPNNA